MGFSLEGSEVPIVVMGAGTMASLVEVVSQGADLYLERTVSISEVLAHIHALLRRYCPSR
jgi:DNA-binding response OmpR family regulator